MSIFKKIFSQKLTIVWASVSVFLIALAIVVSLLAVNVYAPVFNFAFGGPRAVYADGVISMYPTVKAFSKEEAYRNANAMNETLIEEGAVLLKNDNETLPLPRLSKVSVFGKNSVNLSYGNSGSSGGDLSGAKTLYDGLEAANFSCNPELKKFYSDDKRSGAKRAANSSDLDSGGNQMIATAETPQSKYDDTVKKSYAEYSDAAIIVITRIGGEGFDLPRRQGDTAGALAQEDHYLQLDKNEKELLATVSQTFDKVIVLLNIPASMEVSFLTDPTYYAYQSNIDAALYIGFPGKQGTMAVGKIMSGDVNPSGHTVDTWAADFKADPTFVNFGDNNIADSHKYDDELIYFVDYEESQYVGYRYYETRGFTDGDEWYKKNVVYPFGHGLSYTEFDWSVDSSAVPTSFVEGDRIEIEVTVKNTGDVAGKDVVQLYCTPPYHRGQIEKPYKTLVGFAKTPTLRPNEEKTVKLTFDPYYAASYDYNDANNNGFKGYELDAGEYILWVSRDAHDPADNVKLDLQSPILYGEDPVTGNEVVNRYTDQAGYLNSDTQLSTVLSRADWAGTFPNSPTDEERKAPAALIKAIKDESHNNPTDFAKLEMPLFDEEIVMKFRDFLPEETPVPSYEPIVSFDDERWDTFLDQCNADEMVKLVDEGGYQTNAMLAVGVPRTNEYDGPTGFVNFVNKSAVYDVAYYPCGPVVASTWNAELVQEFGETMGEEGIWGNAKGDKMPYTGIWAPGVNIHRSPFGGRNAEYFSEDPLLSGKIAAAEIRGLQSRGVFAGIKHFAANEQETRRSVNGCLSWLTEQSLREIYLRPFEIAVKEGKTRALMTSFNRIGTKWTGGDYRLVTEILRNEWGFRGLVVCDFNTNLYMNSRQMAYAGGDLNLATQPVSWCDTTDTADTIVLRQNTKNILYTIINSNAMNGEIIGYDLAYWQILIIIADCVIGAAIAVWGFFVIRGALKRSRMQ